jgi:hypothetical protein
MIRSCALLLMLLWLVATARAATLTEDFGSDPSGRGWQVFGEGGLFEWNAAEGSLAVTWDSAKTNSYFYRELPMMLTKADDVRVSFDLRLAEVAVGTTPGKPFTFELAAGLFHLASATHTNFARGSASQSPNLVEFDYFPDSGFGATISPIIVSSNNQFVPSFSFPLELTVGDTFHVEMQYRAAEQTLTTVLQRNGAPFGPVKPVVLGPNFTDFRVDTISISSYSDRGAGGSILARGVIDNLEVTTPDPPQVSLQTANGQAGIVQFTGQSGWTYVLERTEDWAVWVPASERTSGTGQVQTLSDGLPNPVSGRAYYRLRLERP